MTIMLKHITAFRLMALHFVVVVTLHFIAVYHQYHVFNLVIPLAAILVACFIFAADSVVNNYVRNRVLLHTIGIMAYLLFLFLVYAA